MMSRRGAVAPPAGPAMGFPAPICCGRNQDRQFQVGLARKVEGHLGETQEAVARVREGALAALAAEHAMCVPPARELEQVGALGAAEPERLGEAVEGCRRQRHVAALLEPRVPGDAEPAELRDFLAPQPGRAPPARARQPEGRGLELLALGADEVAELALLGMRVGGDHGGKDTSISLNLTPVSKPDTACQASQPERGRHSKASRSKTPCRTPRATRPWWATSSGRVRPRIWRAPCMRAAPTSTRSPRSCA